MKSFLFLLFSFGALYLLPNLGAEDPYPRVYRTFMPESGPSAFAVELSPTLALCYDPLRGGINGIWLGSIDRSPTFQAKINAPAEPMGDLIYTETVRQALRLGDPNTVPTARFRGYHYEDGAVTFDILLNGLLVSETLRLSEDGQGIIRTFTLPKGGGEGFFLLEPQPACQITITGGVEEKAGQWRFPAGAQVSFVITPKPSAQP